MKQLVANLLLLTLHLLLKSSVVASYLVFQTTNSKMVMFSQWARGDIGKDAPTKSENTQKSITVEIDALFINEVIVFQTTPDELERKIFIDDVEMTPIHFEFKDNIKGWSQDKMLRNKICKELYACFVERNQFINRHCPTKRALRVSAMDEIIKKGTEQYQFEHFIPEPLFTLHLTVTYPSLFTVFNQLVPYLLAGIPLTVRCNAETAVLVSFISYLLRSFGIPEGVFNQIIDFEATNTRQTVAFVLLESADIDSAINNILECPFIYGLTTVRVFVHESLKKNVQQVLKQKFSCQYDNGKLFQESESFPRFDYVPKIDYDALDFEGFHSGIGLFYYRSESEVVKMLNHLRGIRSMSIWSENFYIAYKMSQDIRSCKYITINSGIEAASDVCSFGWQYELVYCTKISNGLKTFSDGINPRYDRQPRTVIQTIVQH